MSKERLEEIIRDYERIDNGTSEIGIDESYFFYNHADWLIEQAERVNMANKYVRNMQREVDLHTRLYKESEQQNKRYREALEFIGNHADESELMDNIMYTKLVKEVIDKALEGEE